MKCATEIFAGRPNGTESIGYGLDDSHGAVVSYIGPNGITAELRINNGGLNDALEALSFMAEHLPGGASHRARERYSLAFAVLTAMNDSIRQTNADQPDRDRLLAAIESAIAVVRPSVVAVRE